MTAKNRNYKSADKKLFLLLLKQRQLEKKRELDDPASVGCVSKYMKAQMETPGCWPLQGEEYKREVRGLD